MQLLRTWASDQGGGVNDRSQGYTSFSSLVIFYNFSRNTFLKKNYLECASEVSRKWIIQKSRGKFTMALNLQFFVKYGICWEISSFRFLSSSLISGKRILSSPQQPKILLRKTKLVYRCAVGKETSIFFKRLISFLYPLSRLLTVNRLRISDMTVGETKSRETVLDSLFPLTEFARKFVGCSITRR